MKTLKAVSRSENVCDSLYTLLISYKAEITVIDQNSSKTIGIIQFVGEGGEGGGQVVAKRELRQI